MNNFPTNKVSPKIAEAVDFMVEEVEGLSHSILASRMSLNCTDGNLKPQNVTKHFDDNKITIIQSTDQTSIPSHLQEEVTKFYPNAKLALIKGGGDFPFVSAHEEVNLHIEVHLRRNGNFDTLKPKMQESRLQFDDSEGTNNDKNGKNESLEESKENKENRLATKESNQNN